MENIAILNNAALGNTIKLSKRDQEDLNEMVQDDMKAIKLDILQHVLTDKGIKFDDKITDYEELRKSIEKNVDKKIAEEATTMKDGLESELFEAKINGVLDRIYAHKMAYEISLITTREAQIMKSINNDTLDEILTTSYNSLSTLYEKFNDFSETK